MTLPSTGRSESPPVVVGLSGATGMPIAAAVVDRLLGLRVPVACVISNAARLTWEDEMDEPLAAALGRWRADSLFTQYAIGDYRAPIASGTVPTRGMAIVPCSMATVAAVAHGFTTNLLQRAADVHLKERRPLAIVARETPLHAGHLENMARLSRLGAVILPPQPAFYLRPRTVDDIVQFMAQKTLVALGVCGGMEPRFTWSKPDGDA